MVFVVNAKTYARFATCVCLIFHATVSSCLFLSCFLCCVIAVNRCVWILAEIDRPHLGAPYGCVVHQLFIFYKSNQALDRPISLTDCTLVRTVLQFCRLAFAVFACYSLTNFPVWNYHRYFNSKDEKLSFLLKCPWYLPQNSYIPYFHLL